MESISVFDMLKIGVGPSSSHTLGPWRAAQRWIDELKDDKHFDAVATVSIDLYGSLSLTGKGHATDLATVLGLCGYDPVTMPVESIDGEITQIRNNKVLPLNKEKDIPFDIDNDIVFHRKFLPFHPNGMTFKATLNNGKTVKATYYSIGGEFVVKEERKNAKKKLEKFKTFPFQIQKADELLEFCKSENKKISEIVLENERSLR